MLIAPNRKLSNYTQLFLVCVTFCVPYLYWNLNCNLKRRYLVEVTAINVRIILECILNWFRNMWTAFVWL
jgi:hypothetical protein